MSLDSFGCWGSGLVVISGDATGTKDTELGLREICVYSSLCMSEGAGRELTLMALVSEKGLKREDKRNPDDVDFAESWILALILSFVRVVFGTVVSSTTGGERLSTAPACDRWVRTASRIWSSPPGKSWKYAKK